MPVVLTVRLRGYVMLSILLQGFTMGLAYVAPIGMQNLFVINAALTKNRSRAVMTAAFVTLFDMTLTLACFFGVGAIMDAVPGLTSVILLVGGVLVVGIGIMLMVPRRKPMQVDGVTGRGVRAGKDASLRATFGAALVVTWCNPQAFIDGTMMLGAFRATFGGADGLAFVVGACMASVVWFPGLALAVSVLGSRFDDRVLRIINLVCGGVVVIYGVRLLLVFFGVL